MFRALFLAPASFLFPRSAKARLFLRVMSRKRLFPVKRTLYFRPSLIVMSISARPAARSLFIVYRISASG